MVKLDFDTLSTVPDAPPAAGPDRALDPPPPDPRPPAEPLLAACCATEAEADVARPTGTPITAHMAAAATTHRLLVFQSDLRILRRRDGLDVVLESGRAGGVASGVVESYSFMMALLLLR